MILLATNLEELKDDLYYTIRLRPTPIEYDDKDYRKFIEIGLKRLYVDIGWQTFQEDYVSEQVVSDTTGELEVHYFLKRDLTLAEREYVLVAAEIAFKHQIKEDVSTLVSYTTDALSITQADKPYKYISEDIDRLEQRLNELFFKL